MHRRTLTTIASAILAVVLVVGIAACSDGPDRAQAPTTTASIPPVPATSGGQICNRLTADAVAEATDLVVAAGTPASGPPPSCSYPYAVSGAAKPSTITVTGRRPDVDLNGLSGKAAFDFASALYAGYAGKSGGKAQPVKAGERAVRIQGATATVGLVQAGGVVFSVIVPNDAVKPERVDDLLVAMGTTLG